MKRVTKADLEERNAKLSTENFALTLPLAYNLDLDSHRVGVVSITDSANGNSHVVLSRVEVFHFLPWRADGGCVWLREPTGEKSPRRSTFHITAMTQVDFNRFCEEKASLGQYEWREVQAACNAAVNRAFDAEIHDGEVKIEIVGVVMPMRVA